MIPDLDLEPLARAIKETLPPGYTFVLFIQAEPTPAEMKAGAEARTQLVSPMTPQRTFLTMKTFVEKASTNPLFK